MARYHFNIEDGLSYPDREGAEFPDLDSARIEAVRRSGTLLRDSAVNFWNGDAWKLIVTNSSGLIMFTLHFVAVNSPVTQHYAARLSQQEGRPTDEYIRLITAPLIEAEPA